MSLSVFSITFYVPVNCIIKTWEVYAQHIYKGLNDSDRIKQQILRMIS